MVGTKSTVPVLCNAPNLAEGNATGKVRKHTSSLVIDRLLGVRETVYKYLEPTHCAFVCKYENLSVKLAHHLIISHFCYFILPLHHILLENNVFLTPLHYLISVVTS